MGERLNKLCKGSMRDSRERCVMCKIDEGGLVVRDRGEREGGVSTVQERRRGVCVLCERRAILRNGLGKILA